MNKTKKQLISLLLVLVMLFGMIPAGVFTITAADAAITADTDYTKWATDESGAYLIDSEAKLLGFATLVNSTVGYGETFKGKTFKLTKDMDLNPTWTASSTKPTNPWPNANDDYFQGTFDGQGYTISGLYVNAASNNMGMFVGAEGIATIKNFALINSYFGQTGGKDRLAAICPSMGTNGKVTIENVYVDAIVEGVNSAGGIIGTLKDSGSSATIKGCVFAGSVSGKNFVGGIAANGNGKTLTIENCANLGTVSAADYVGGILGRADSNATVTNCVNLGSISKTASSASYSGSIWGYAGTSGTVSNCYYTQAAWDRTQGSSSKATATNCNKIELIDMATTLSSDQNFSAWSQVKDYIISLPSYFTGSDAKELMKSTVEAKAESLHKIPIEPDISWFDTTQESTEGKVWEISTVAQLLGFAQLANCDEAATPLNGTEQITPNNFAGQTIKLTNDIDLNPGWDASTKKAPTNLWPQNNCDYFAGTFDGQGYTISGLYVSAGANNVGMFVGASGTATIKDFVLKNSYFNQTGGKNRVAAICPSAGTNASVTIEDIYVDAIVSGPQSAGGILGVLQDSGSSAVVNRCVFAGTVTSNAKYVGGIVGNGNSKPVTITDCVNLGTITASDEVGGIIGRNGTETTTITRCVNLGSVEYSATSGNQVAGDILGYQNGGSAVLTDCYWTNRVIKAGVIKDKVANGDYSGIPTMLSLSNTATALKNNASFSNWTVVGAHAFPTSVVNLKNTTLEAKVTALTATTVSIKTYTGNEPMGTIFTISNADELLYASKLSMSGVEFSGQTLMLGADIDLNPGWNAAVTVNGTTATLPEIPGTSFAGFKEFYGTFDGQNHTISGIFMAERLSDSHLAIFRNIHGASILNLKVTNSFIFGEGRDGEVSGRRVAGLIANNKDSVGSIENCYLDMNVWYRGNTAHEIGGVAARTDVKVLFKNIVFNGVVGNMQNNNTVPSTSTGYAMGGIIAQNNSLKNEFIACSATATYYGTDGDNKKVAVGGNVTNAIQTNIATAPTMTAGSASAGWSFGIYPEATKDSKTESYNADTQSRVYYYSSITTDNHAAYINTLKDAGYTEVYTNTVDGNTYTMLNNGVYSVYVSLIKDKSEANTYRASVSVTTYDGNVPNFDTEAKGTVSEKLWQLNVDNWYSKQAGGMGYIMRLSNGKFIVVDGGYNSRYDAANIYKILSENNVLGGKPVIEAWFVTHAHDDHFGALDRFSKLYKDDVIVEGFYGNFPAKTITPNTTGADTLENANVYLTTLAASAFRNSKGEMTPFYKLHTGMNLAFADATALVLYTQEDGKQSYYKGSTLTKNDFTDGNDTSTVIQFIIGGQKIMITGDASTAADNAIMGTWSSTTLKSDIVQVSHHGYDGLSKAFYTAVAAPVALWPADLVVYNNDGTIDKMDNGVTGDDYNTFYYLYASNSGRDANVWLRNNTSEVIDASENACLSLPYTTGTYTGVANMKSNSTAAQNYFTAKYKAKSGLADTNGGTTSNAAFLDGEGGTRADYNSMKLFVQATEATDGKFSTRFTVAISGIALADCQNFGMELVITRKSDSAKATYDKNTTTVWNSVVAAGNTVTAAQMGGYDYLYVVSYNDTPTTDTFSANVKLYYTDNNGEKVYFSETTVDLAPDSAA